MKPFLVGVHAAAVGGGISRSIHATRGEVDGPEAWVHLCITAADEAYAAVLDDPPPAEPNSLERVMDMLLEGDGSSPPLTRAELGIRERPAPAFDPSVVTSAKAAAAMAFRCCMPKLTGRRNAQSYIACVAAGVQRGYFTGSEAKSLLYTAQLALSAYPSRRAPRSRK